MRTRRPQDRYFIQDFQNIVAVMQEVSRLLQAWADHLGRCLEQGIFKPKEAQE